MDKYVFWFDGTVISRRYVRGTGKIEKYYCCTYPVYMIYDTIFEVRWYE